MARHQPHSVRLDRYPEILAADRHRVLVDACDLSHNLDLLPAADVRRGVHDRMWLMVRRDQNADPVLCHALAHGCRYGDLVADLYAALGHAITMPERQIVSKRQLMEQSASRLVVFRCAARAEVPAQPGAQTPEPVRPSPGERALVMERATTAISNVVGGDAARAHK